MYATILEELELSNGLSFLNIGSGSGYLSCLAACLLGESGLSHGIDVSRDVVTHSENCCKQWFDHLVSRRENGEENLPVVTKEGVHFVSGNCFNIDIERAISSCRYDRIYVGAGCPEARKEFFLSLLADDGILIASINEKNELIKVRRTHRHIYAESHISQVIFAPLIEPDPQEEVYELRPIPRERLNSVSSMASATTTEDGFLSLSSSPSSVITFSSSPSNTAPLMTLSPLPNRAQKKIILPPLLWAPSASRHRQFSRVFKEAVFSLLVAARHPRYYTAIVGPPANQIGVTKMCNPSRLPYTIWMYVISYASR
jgi:protein-L-isoaspartate O-methyltransferase